MDLYSPSPNTQLGIQILKALANKLKMLKRYIWLKPESWFENIDAPNRA
jgi:hypothetical protein